MPGCLLSLQPSQDTPPKQSLDQLNRTELFFNCRSIDTNSNMINNININNNSIAICTSINNNSQNNINNNISVKHLRRHLHKPESSRQSFTNGSLTIRNDKGTDFDCFDKKNPPINVLLNKKEILLKSKREPLHR